MLFGQINAFYKINLNSDRISIQIIHFQIIIIQTIANFASPGHRNTLACHRNQYILESVTKTKKQKFRFLDAKLKVFLQELYVK